MTLLNRSLALVGSVLPSLLLGVVLVVVSADVFMRTVMRNPLHIAHDLAIVAFAGVVWFGIIGAAVSDQLFGVQYFVEKLPRRLRRPAQILAHGLVIAIALAVLRASYAQVQTSRFTTFLALGWPKWIVPAGLGLAMAAIIVVEVIKIVERLRRRPAE